MSGLSAKPRKPLPAQDAGGLIAELAMNLTRIAESQTRQAEAIRLLADRVGELEGMAEQEPEIPRTYLNGKPIR